MNLNLGGKRALVCGASQGIGEAIAHELALLGCEVVCLARNEVKLQAVVKSLADGSNHHNHRYLVCDVNDKNNLIKILDEEIQNHGGFHILINNSGGPPAGAILEATSEAFNQAFQHHLITSSLLSQKLIPFMKENQFGRIVNILSTSVKTPLPHLGVSNTIRWAVASWAKTLSQEVGPFGITVNCVLPGATSTERLQTLIENKSKKEKIDYAEEEKRWLSVIPAARFGKPEEIAAAAAFFCTPAAAYINGVALAVDGGRTGTL